MFTINVLIVFALLVEYVICTDPLITINQGQLKGSSFVSRSGRNFFAFQGIPYAKPPLGNLRFKAPEPADPWEGILNATSQPSACIQKNLYRPNTKDILSGSEDCLYLNVYTPKLPKGDVQNLPVMVLIPGGGFSTGDGGMQSYGPKYLMDKDIVFVTMNYRLGILGFLSTEDDVSPGNYGLKDQALVLRWVKENIAKFGGDNKKVTLFGPSAGSVSVSLHLLSPLSKGLFHKAILESGTAYCSFFIVPPGLAKRHADAVASIVGCPSDSKDMIDCLRLIPAETFPDLYYDFFEWEVFPSISFSYVAENCHKYSDSFLCDYPINNKYKQESLVPTIIGMTTGEGGLFASLFYNETGLIYPELNFNERFNRLISAIIQYDYTASYKDINFISEKIKERYYPEGTSIKTNPNNTVDMLSGGLFFKGIIDMANRMLSPAYFYVYDYQSAGSVSSIYPYSLGVSHTAEMMAIFSHEGYQLKKEDEIVSKLLVDIWTNFAISDKVTIDGTSTGDIWPRYNEHESKYLLINSSTPIVSEGLYVDVYEFWSSLPLTSNVKPRNIQD